MNLTPFGKLTRQYRIHAGVLLMEMADYLRLTPSQLSGIEVGRLPLDRKIIEPSITFFAKYGVDARTLRNS